MIPSAEAELAVGIGFYATIGEPCHARIKSSDEDFRVEEFISTGEISAEARADYYPLYRVQKRSIDTMHMAKELSRALKSKVSYGGLKDKRALAIQYVTPTSRRSATPSEVVGERFSATLVGYVPHPLSRGALVGNRFQVILRECCAEVENRIEDAIRLAKERRVPNFYGLQRFGASGLGTHRIGRALVRREFGEAVRLMLVEPRIRDDEVARVAREEMAAGRYAEGLRILPKGQDVEALVARALVRKPGDWVGALRAVPVRLRRLYVQAYQSMIFNMTLTRASARGEDISAVKAGDNWATVSEDGMVTSEPRGVREPMSGEAVPMVQLVGYAYRDYGSRFDGCVKEALGAEGVGAKDFYVQEMQEVSCEGGFRRPHLAIADPSSNIEGGTAFLKFGLSRGQYATIFLREVVKPRDPVGAGFA